MKNLIPVLIIAISSVLAVSTFADDQSAIRQAVVYDSAMSHTDFERIANSKTGTNPFDITDKSLTYMVISLNVEDDDDANQDFRLLDAANPKPAAMANEIYRVRVTGGRRILTGPVTMLHADRITSMTCDVKGDVATGIVAFKVPRLYQGAVRYKAHRAKSGWVVSEFEMPNRKIHLVRNQDGFWIPKSN